MINIYKSIIMLIMCAILVACGGGSSGESQKKDSKILTELSFQPQILSGNYKQGTSLTLTTHITLSNSEILKKGIPFIKIIDADNILTETRNFIPINANSLSATFQTNPQLPLGLHKGTIKVQLCSDEKCSIPYMDKFAELPYSISVTEEKAPLNISILGSTQSTVYSSGISPNDIEINIEGFNLKWTAKTTASWFKTNKISGYGNDRITLHYNTSHLTPGNYSEKIIIESDDGQEAEVPLELTVLETQFQLTSDIPQFSAVNGSSILPQKINFELNSSAHTSWNATSSANWLKIDPENGTTPSMITLQPVTTNLSNGSYTADIILASDKATTKKIPVNLYLMEPLLGSSTNAINFGDLSGKDFSSQTLFFNLSTDQYWNWELHDLPLGIISSAVKGKVNQNGTSINLAIDPTRFPTGVTSKIIKITAKINGDYIELPITLNINIAERKLLASEWGIAFTSKPEISSLEKEITIFDNYHSNLEWTASSDQPWLNITKSGNTKDNNTLKVNAAPNSLPKNTMSYATITIKSNSTQIKPIYIKVGLWKDDLLKSPVPVNLANFLNSKADASSIKIPTLDKIRPFIYAVNPNDQNIGIGIYNVYTLTKTADIKIENVNEILNLAVSPDGDKLYARVKEHKYNNLPARLTTKVYDLYSLKQISEIDTPNFGRIMRINGLDTLLVSDGFYILENSSHKKVVIGGISAFSNDGSKLFLRPTVSDRNDDLRKVLEIDISPSYDILTRTLSSVPSHPLVNWNIAINNNYIYNAEECNISDINLKVITSFKKPQNTESVGMSFDNKGNSVCAYVEMVETIEYNPSDPNSYNTNTVYKYYLSFFNNSGEVVKKYPISSNNINYYRNNITRLPDGLSYISLIDYNGYIVMSP